MTTRHTEQERHSLGQQFAIRIAGMDLGQLRILKKTYSREMAKGRSPAEDFRLDELLLTQLILRERELAAQLSPASEVDELVRQHHVSRKVAENFLARQERERDPLDVTRKHRTPAPDPEPAEVPGNQQREPQEDLRPYRVTE